jgi:hypothetical protein
MNGYIAYYGNDRAEVRADTTIAARDRAIAIFQKQNPRRRIKPFEVSVILTEKGGEQVTHSTASL